MARPSFWRRVVDAVAVKGAREIIFYAGGLIATFAITHGLDETWFRKHWPTLAWISGSVVFLVVVASLINKYASLVYRYKVSVWSGISRVYPVQKFGDSKDEVRVSERDEAEEALTEAVRSSTKLKLLLVSGWRHIGCDKHQGLLWNAIRGRNTVVELEILMLDPASEEARENPRGLHPAQYAEGINAVLHTLADWKNKFGNLRITVRLYKEHPIWQFVVTEDEMWLQCAHGVPNDRSPIYCLKLASAKEFGLAYGLLGVWERRWRTSVEVDLGKVLERAPAWEKIVNLPRFQNASDEAAKG